MSKKKNKFIIFFIALSVVSLAFFYFYHKSLGLGFSGITALVIIICTLDYMLAVNIFRKPILRFIFVFCTSVFFAGYALVNFAFYNIFKSFWRINLSQLNQLNKPFMELLITYAYLIPKHLYIGLAIFILSLCYFSAACSIREDKMEIESAKNCRINFLEENKKNYFSILVFLMIFCLLNMGIFFLLQIYKKNKIFSREKYYADISICGYLFDEAFGYGQRSVENLTKGESEIPSIKKDIEIVKDNLAKLALLNNAAAQENAHPAILDKPNIIIYQMESVDAWALKQKPSPMPFLQKMIDENVSVKHFFSNSCTTINTEFSSICSFYPESNGPVSDLFSYNDYYCLPSLLKDRYGYVTSFYHANSGKFWNRDVLNPRWGYENNYFDYKLRQSDGAVLDDMVEKIKEGRKPSFNYVTGFTSHGPHNQEFIDFNFYENNLIITPYAHELNPDILSVDADETTIRAYFGFLSAIDKSIENLFQKLEENDLLGNTIVVIYGDHRYYNFNSDDKIRDFYNYNEVPFMMYVPNSYQGSVKNIASQIDIAPSLFSLIGGENQTVPNNFIGQSIFSKAHSNSAVIKCLGETLYVDENIILKKDLLLDIVQPIGYLQKNADIKMDSYSRCLSEVVNKSDRILADNKLCMENNGKMEMQMQMQLNFDQETDADKDGLSDLREKAIGTDPQNFDTDGDGVSDGIEFINGQNPLGKGEGLPKRISAGKDSDNDGLTDLEEAAWGTDKKNSDTDNDGYLDGGEIIRGYNPLGKGEFKKEK